MDLRTYATRYLPAPIAGTLKSAKYAVEKWTFPKQTVSHRYGPFEFTMRIHDRVAKEWYDRPWELPPEIEFLSRSGHQPGTLVFDLGAHQCLIAMMLAKTVACDGRVVAVEANRHNARVGALNVEANGIANVEVMHALISDRVGKDFAAVGFNSSKMPGNGSKAGGELVDSVSIDELARSLGSPRIVYMDIEGFEIEALRGAAQTLRRPCTWFIEMHGDALLSRYGARNRDVLRFFPADRFDAYLCRETQDRFAPLADRNSIPPERCFAIFTPVVRPARSPRTNTDLGRAKSLTLKGAAEFDQMARMIQDRIGGRSVAFLTNPGNFGDALIEAGAAVFLKAHGIRHRWYNSRRLRELHAKYYKLAYAKNESLRLLSGGLYERYPISLHDIAKRHKVAIICGSGGFSAQAHVAMQILELCAAAFEDIIVLPSTYAIAPPVEDHILFFARDRFASMAAIPSATFCHDLAFFLDPDPVAPSRRVGYHFRTDGERSGELPLLEESFDVSASGTELDPAEQMFEEVGKSEIIVTDRLHVSTAAALLGRRTYLFRGNYFKNEAIYKSSLQPHYPHVTLLDDWRQLPEGVRP